MSRSCTSPGASAGQAFAAGGHHAPPPFDLGAWLRTSTETWAAGLDPVGAGGLFRDRRLSDLIDRTMSGSPLYRRRNRGARCLADFEPIAKTELMSNFDEWATDRAVTLQAAEAFVADPACIADAWLDRYLVWTSSGTSGHPGLFVQDGASLAAYDAIDAQRLRGNGIGTSTLGWWGLGRRFAFVGAIGGHFAGHVSFERLRRIVPALLAPETHMISVLEPLTRIAERLQAIRPDVLITYPSCGAALAQLQAEGLLNIAPQEVWLGGEQLSPAQRRTLQSAFGCTVRNAYGASEFYSIAFECALGHLHLNDDWVVLEALDAQLRPVSPGVLSSVTLLTNLANQTQPLLRYRLDDLVRFAAAPCACGCAFPVIEVHGRCDDTLQLPGRDGRRVSILPLALETLVEERTGLSRFQVLQGHGADLELRLDPTVPNTRAALEACRVAVAAFLEGHGAVGTRIVLSRRAPMQQAGSGKLRRVIGVSGQSRPQRVRA